MEADTFHNKMMRPQTEFVTLYCEMKIDAEPQSAEELVPVLNQRIQEMSLVIEKLQKNVDFLNKEMVKQN